MFSEIVQANLRTYLDAPTRVDKTMVVAYVLDQVLETGARFVKKNKTTNQWDNMTREEAHHKTGHAIRDMIRQMEKGNGKNTSVTNTKPTTPSKSKALQAKKTLYCDIDKQRREESLFAAFLNHAPKTLIMDNGDKMSFESASSIVQSALQEKKSTPNTDLFDKWTPVVSTDSDMPTFNNGECFDDTPIELFDAKYEESLLESDDFSVVCDILFS